MREIALHAMAGFSAVHGNSLHAAVDHSGIGAVLALGFLILFIGAGRSGGQGGK